MTLDDFEKGWLPSLRERQEVGEIRGLKRRGDRLVLQIEFGEHEIDAMIDADGRPLIDPPRRRVAIEIDTAFDSGSVFLRDPPNPTQHPPPDLPILPLLAGRPQQQSYSRKVSRKSQYT